MIMKFLRKHQKKFLAVFTAGLMIVFIADVGVRRYRDGGNGERGRLIGEAGDFKIHLTDLRNAEDELRFLGSSVLFMTDSANPEERFIPVLYQVLPPEIADEWVKNPAVYLLLLEEARRIPVYADPRLLEYYMKQVVIRDGDRTVELSAVPRYQTAVQRSLTNLLVIRASYERAVDAIKISRPLLQHELIMGAQQITLDFLQLDARPRTEKAPQPTDEQLAEQFRRFADVPVGSITPDNPHGFGYQIPQRVKLQYIVLPREQLRSAVRARKDDYAWELEARKYYLQNQRQFTVASTQPATEPATQPAVRPFEEVREEILTRLTTPEVNRLSDQVVRYIHETMRSDYEQWVQSSAPATAPATAPAAAAPATQPLASSLGVRYDSFDYLQRLAESVQQKFGVLPAVHSIAEPQSAEQLSAIEGIGTFTPEIFFLSAPFLPQQMRNDPAALQVWEPSDPRSGNVGDSTYIYRLAEAVPAHAPEELNAVREQVAADVQRQWAWEQALAEARQLLEQARAAGDLKAAATDRPITTTGPFPRNPEADVEGVEFESSPSRANFVLQAYELVSTAATQPSGQPIKLIELPSEMKLYIAQLRKVQTQMTPQQLELLQVQWPRMMRLQWARAAIDQWLRFENVAQRMNYTDHDAPQRSAAAQVP